MEFKNPRLFIDGISQEITATTLTQHFSEYGEVKDALIISHKGIRFVTFSNPLMAKNALQRDHIILGQKVVVKPAEPKIQISNRKIFVGGLPCTITLEEFKEYFGSYGTITDAVVIYDKESKKCKGFGFVTYDSEEAEQNVLRKKFHQLNNKMVEVKRATPKEEMKTDFEYENYYYGGGVFPFGIYDVNSQPVLYPPPVGNCYFFWVAIPGGYQPHFGSYRVFGHSNSNPWLYFG